MRRKNCAVLFLPLLKQWIASEKQNTAKVQGVYLEDINPPLTLEAGYFYFLYSLRVY